MKLRYLDGLHGCGVGADEAPATTASSGTASGNGSSDQPKEKAITQLMVVPSKAMDNASLMSATKLLDKLGLPFVSKLTDKGEPVYEVTTPSGTQTVSSFVPIASEDALTQSLTAPPTPGKISTTSSPMTSEQVKTGLKVLAGLTAAGIGIAIITSATKSKPSTGLKGLGKPVKRKKKMAEVRL